MKLSFGTCRSTLFGLAIWAAAVPLISATSGCGGGTAHDKPVAQAGNADLREQVVALANEIKDLRAQLAGGERPSADLLSRVSTLEGKIANKSEWPKSAEEAKQLRDAYEAIASEAPVAMPVEFSKRLGALRWNTEAVSYLAADELKNPQDGSFDEVESVCRDLLATSPENANADIKGRMQAALAAADVKVRSARLNTATASARAAVAATAASRAPENDPAKQSEAFHALELAFNKLEPFKDDQQAKGLRTQIEHLVSEQEFEEQLKRIGATLDIAEKSRDARIRQAGILRAMGDAIEMHYRLAAENGTASGDSLKRVAKLMKRCEDGLADPSAAEQVRKYQSWALGQIQEYDRWHFDSALADIKAEFATFQSPAAPAEWELLRKFPEVRRLLSDKTGVEIQGPTLSVETQTAIYGKVYGRVSWSYADDLVYCATREAAEKYLLPIDARLLEPPVARFYDKSFAKAWQKLEDRPEYQLDVAKATAIIQKKALDDL